MFEVGFSLCTFSAILGALLVFGPPGTSELGKGLGDGIRGFRLAITDVPEPTGAKLPNLKSVRGRQAPV
jgi:Sec-independent protein translocase protein TatA